MRDNVSKLGTCYSGLGLPVYKTSINGPAVQLPNYNAATIYIMVGTYTDGTHAFTVQEAPDGSTWTNVAATDLVAWQATGATNFYPQKNGFAQPAAISNAATAVNQRIGYIGAQPYIRVITTVSGSPVTGCAYDVVIVAGEPRLMPASV